MHGVSRFAPLVGCNNNVGDLVALNSLQGGEVVTTRINIIKLPLHFADFGSLTPPDTFRNHPIQYRIYATKSRQPTTPLVALLDTFQNHRVLAFAILAEVLSQP